MRPWALKVMLHSLLLLLYPYLVLYSSDGSCR
jgi:hypothetical protein